MGVPCYQPTNCEGELTRRTQSSASGEGAEEEQSHKNCRNVREASVRRVCRVDEEGKTEEGGGVGDRGTSRDEGARA